MSPKNKLLINKGDRFDRLSILEETEGRFPSKNISWKIRYFKCLCDCGNIINVSLQSLRRGLTKSCGCLNKEQARKTCIRRNSTHNKSKTRIYKIWKGIKYRCRNSAVPHKDYGGRGIRVCNEWTNDFQNFYDWAINSGYQEDLTIERKDVNGNYEPENCTWIPLKEQSCNKRNNRLLTIFNETKYIAKWSKDPRCKVKSTCFCARIYHGWNPEKALITPNKYDKFYCINQT